MYSSFHVCAYKATEGASDSNKDMTAITDSVITARNNHFILSEKYRLLGLSIAGLHVNNLRSNIPTWNSIGRHRVWPIDVSANANRPNNYPRFQDLRDVPMMLPTMEEIAWEESTTSSGATSAGATLAMFFAPAIAWNQNLAQGGDRMVLQATFTNTSTAGSWSGAQALTLADNIRGGWYSVNAAYCTPATTSDPAYLFRLLFPRAPQFPPDSGGGGRILRPGSFMTDQIGNLEPPGWAMGLGEWGRFHSTELPQVETLSIFNSPSAITYTVRLDVTFLNTNPP